jgi:GNAT superfamily N-acetyltransferase
MEIKIVDSSGYRLQSVEPPPEVVWTSTFLALVDEKLRVLREIAEAAPSDKSHKYSEHIMLKVDTSNRRLLDRWNETAAKTLISTCDQLLSFASSNPRVESLSELNSHIRNTKEIRNFFLSLTNLNRSHVYHLMDQLLPFWSILEKYTRTLPPPESKESTILSFQSTVAELSLPPVITPGSLQYCRATGKDKRWAKDQLLTVAEDLPSLRSPNAIQNRRTHSIFLARLNGCDANVGLMQLRFDSEGIHIDAISTLAQMRGKGVGRWLFQTYEAELISRIGTSNRTPYFITQVPAGNSGAVRFFNLLGFKKDSSFSNQDLNGKPLVKLTYTSNV